MRISSKIEGEMFGCNTRSVKRAQKGNGVELDCALAAFNVLSTQVPNACT